MSSLRFSDGMTINTGGELRVIRKSDGYYVVGEGTCAPVDSLEDGLAYVSFLKGSMSEYPSDNYPAGRRSGGS